MQGLPPSTSGGKASRTIRAWLLRCLPVREPIAAAAPFRRKYLNVMVSSLGAYEVFQYMNSNEQRLISHEIFVHLFTNAVTLDTFLHEFLDVYLQRNVGFIR